MIKRFLKWWIFGPEKPVIDHDAEWEKTKQMVSEKHSKVKKPIYNWRGDRLDNVKWL